ncbi:UDP-4-amino-4,6-dideoxy-N-acetyl-beta-L-altrosamine transaminase [Methanolobus vulcani]|jgi:UDP-4-keto-6-deoxy-N-acetylglucosamine 4-aminotransferase|uniref:UDP-4-amino-4,6-dideoxy-N-acetyl-beta-L-altrosamine transaminase n=1 Tax=Methanolobus vulcani TaxID=38026 RepID=A0A7Z7AVH9_9EURY|nr:UDP-4-amino-4,6-dideoxy-N-acetyl-beta-L-altrosamine transaminase [Methanolobus vulcani]SDF57647.1 UDP-4-amino-4,6-dideoxy-N-acetyl-beta-L-altrosamine transaminase [Methanolobus vulcani]
MKYIPYGFQWIDENDIREVISVLKSDWITTGPKIQEFEDALCRYTGASHSVAVNSGTSALDISVQSLELPPSSEVITTPFTFVATSNSIIYNGLKPVFADICEDTRNIDPDSIRNKISERTKAIIYVDYAGQPCDIKEIKEIAEDFDLYLIEDASHAIGSEYENKKTGTFADMTIFSFHPVKHITTGEGGAVLTDNEELHEKLSMLRSHGIDKTTSERYGPDASWAYDMKYLGRNYRITDFQAALGISQLGKLDSYLDKRREIAGIYSELFADVPEITIPSVRKNLKHSWHLYTVLIDSRVHRDVFFGKMRANNIGVNLHYIPIYKFSYYQGKYGSIGELPVTEDVFKRIITLPLFPRMQYDDVLKVVETTKKLLSK